MSGELDHVEPVAADLGGRVAREVAAGDVEARRLGIAGREQTPLEDQRPLVFSAVEAGVVDADRGAGRELGGQGAVPLAEGLAALGAGELDEADDDVVRDHRHGEGGVDEPALVPRHVLDAPGAQGDGAGGVEGVAVDRAESGLPRVPGVGADTGEDTGQGVGHGAGMGHPAQLRRAGAGLLVVPAPAGG